MNTKKPLLTISLLISNRPDTIPRCLDSLHLIMDQLPCELILIDTSKSEDINNLLLTYTNKVYEFEWCKDFAKARNEGVKRAKGEWFLYLDDDEWLVDVDEIIKFFKSKAYKKHECANVQIRNFLNTEHTEHSDSWVTRLFYLGGGAQFYGKVHEYIYPIYGEPKFLMSMIHHTGYIYETEEKRRKHFERNTEILLDVIKEEPHNLRWRSQLVQEYRVMKDWESIVKVCKEVIPSVTEVSTFMQRNHFCTLYAGFAEGLSTQKRCQEALDVCEKGLNDKRSTDLLKSLLYLYKTINYVELKDWKSAQESINKYFEGYQYFKKHREQMNDQLGALLVHRVFEQDYIQKAYNLLIYIELQNEGIDIPLAENEEEQQIKIDAISGIKFVRAMVNLIATKEYRSAFDSFLKNVSQEETLCKWACAEVQQWEKKDQEGFRRLVYAFSKVKSDFWYVRYCNVLEADIRGDKGEIEDKIEELIEVLQNVFYMPDKIYEIIDKYGIIVARIWNKLSREEWSKQIKSFVEQCEEIYIDKAYNYLLMIYEENDWHVEVLVLALQERMLAEQKREETELLRKQIVEQVEELLLVGQKQVALQFIEQLQRMFPGDKEIETIVSKIENQ